MTGPDIKMGGEPVHRRHSRAWLRVEFVTMFIGAPALIALFLPPIWMFRALGVLTVVGLVLLARTPGFRWAYLLRGWSAVRLFPVITVAVGTAAAGYLIMLQWAPDDLFRLIRWRPEVMLIIALFYPLVSALPQELLFRPLYFRRYGAVLPQGASGIVLNAAIFAFAHLMYWSVIVTVMTFAGGLIFAWAYEVRRSFPLAVILHSVAGVVLFALGMGLYFYSGNVERPF